MTDLRTDRMSTLWGYLPLSGEHSHLWTADPYPVNQRPIGISRSGANYEITHVLLAACGLRQLATTAVRMFHEKAAPRCARCERTVRR